MEDLEQTLRTIRSQNPDTRIAVALSHGSNVTGNVIDLSRVSELCSENRATWILDAAQTMGIIPIDMRRLRIDILCFSGHKALMGPQGTGAIIVRRGINISPLMAGGSGIRTFLETMPQEMPEHLEAGTQNAHSIAGLHAALTFAEGKREAWKAQALGLRKQLLSGIDAINRQAGEERIHVYGREEAGNPAQAGSQDESGPVLPTVAFNIGHLEAADVADRLWRGRQIAVRAGGHCAPLIHRFFGTEKRGIVRASFSHANTPGQVQNLIEELKKVERSL
jgi:selenocysteine lyase/cysteine desulfurase